MINWIKKQRRKLIMSDSEKALKELIEKYNVPTELQKDLGAVTDKYFLIKWFCDVFREYVYYWIYSRQSDGTLGERKGKVVLFGSPFAVCESEAELNKMCDGEVQAEQLKRRRHVMQDRFTSL